MRNVDYLVLGLGAMGSATLFHLARKGLKVIGLEQFQIGHALGSSGGRSRVFRTFYHDPLYVSLAQAALPLWQELETLTGQPLLHLNGFLAYAKPGNADFERCVRVLEEIDFSLELLTAPETAKRFPGLKFPDDVVVAYTPQAGFIDATRAVFAHLGQAQRFGAEIHAHTQVTQVDLSRDHPEVETNAGRYRCQRLVITTGPWAAQVLGDLSLPLKVTRQQKFYFRPARPDGYRPDQLPIYTDYDRLYYGFPYHDAGLKVAEDIHGPEVLPDPVDRTPDVAQQNKLHRWLETIMPGGRFSFVKGETCMYTLTPDQDFLIGPHPNQPNVLVGGGFSGHGFKFSALIGLILAQLASQGTTDYPLKRFRLDRFG